MCYFDQDGPPYVCHVLAQNMKWRLAFRNYYMLFTLYKIGEVHFRLLGTNGFHLKAKNERFTAVGLRCRQNLKYEKFASLGRLPQKIASKSVPHVQHDHFSLFKQLNR